MDELGLTACGACPSWRRCAASSRTRTTTSTSSATRWRCSRSGSALEGDLERFAGDLAAEVDAFLAEPLADELTRRDALRFGALFHDLGKPETRSEGAGGYVTFIGHDEVGARDHRRDRQAASRSAARSASISRVSRSTTCGSAS